ncbi:response regulator transcription factor [Candidatus Nitrosopumilus sediminis]|uniref:Response regulator receiver protein n=1 Tax=Candidatus Nitrosopumilus sediminis TaxID=1229909 RepID=K0BFA1_9ARCH|nr:response regulator [Candidatus Nitrosopumilus sediminis]AFS82966.1 response regulator receiver protein [Candidatus Nitrosopumilus sediminis]
MVNCIVIDDDQYILGMFCDFLDVLKIDVLATGSNGKDAVELYEKHAPDIVFTDLAMPEYDGVYAVENIKDKNPNAKIIVVTANSNDCKTDLFELINIPVISKPFSMNVLKQTIEDVSKTEISMPASFEIKYKFKDDYDSYSCKVNYEQYRNFKKLDIIEKCEIINSNNKNIQSDNEMQKALDLASQNNTSKIRDLSKVVTT